MTNTYERPLPDPLLDQNPDQDLDEAMGFRRQNSVPSRIIQAVQSGKLCMTLVVPPLDDSIPPGVDEVGSQTGYRLNLGFNTATENWILYMAACVEIYHMHTLYMYIMIYNKYITYFIILKVYVYSIHISVHTP